MPFQTVDATKRMQGRSASSQEPTVAFYGKTSQFRLNAAAVALLGNPEKLEVLHDPDTSRIAFVPANEENASRAVTLRADSKTADSRYFGFKALANLLGIVNGGRVTSPITQDAESGYYVASFAAPAEEATEAPAEAESTGRRSR